jgi:hypothetical protein
MGEMALKYGPRQRKIDGAETLDRKVWMVRVYRFVFDFLTGGQRKGDNRIGRRGTQLVVSVSFVDVQD